jgi:predicted RNA-binding protein with RPS1 domain
MRTEFELHKHLQRTEKCAVNSEIAYKIKDSKETIIKLCPFRCHSYFCEHCFLIKRTRLRNKIQSVFKNGRWRFLTLTLDRKLYSNEIAIQKMNYFFNLFWKRFKDNNQRFSYFKIVEFTKNGMIHLHILINKYLKINEIRDVWRSITGSFMVWIVDIKNKGMLSLYLSKYLSKSSNKKHNEYFYLNKTRRYSYSQQLDLPKDEPTGFHRTYILFNPDKNQNELIKLFLLYTLGIEFNGKLTLQEGFT